MKIDLFSISCERNRVDKTEYLSGRFTIEGQLRNESSVIDPIITIEKTNPNTVPYNYMYIAEFGRWYFINNIESIRTKLWKISAHVDVLYTYRVQICNSKAILERTSQLALANMYYNNGAFTTEARTYNTIHAFPNKVTGNSDNGNYILICSGGSG